MCGWELISILADRGW